MIGLRSAQKSSSFDDIKIEGLPSNRKGRERAGVRPCERLCAFLHIQSLPDVGRQDELRCATFFTNAGIPTWLGVCCVMRGTLYSQSAANGTQGALQRSLLLLLSTRRTSLDVYHNVDVSSTMLVVEEMVDALPRCRSGPFRSRRSRAESERSTLSTATHARASEKSAKAPRVMITYKLNSCSPVRKDMGLRIAR